LEKEGARSREVVMGYAKRAAITVMALLAVGAAPRASDHCEAPSTSQKEIRKEAAYEVRIVNGVVRVQAGIVVKGGKALARQAYKGEIDLDVAHDQWITLVADGAVVCADAAETALSNLNGKFEALRQGVPPDDPLHREFDPGTGGAGDIFREGVENVLQTAWSPTFKAFDALGDVLHCGGFSANWTPAPLPVPPHPSVALAAAVSEEADGLLLPSAQPLGAGATCTGNVRVPLHIPYADPERGLLVELLDAATNQVVQAIQASTYLSGGAVTFTGIPPGNYTVRTYTEVFALFFTYGVPGEPIPVTVPAWDAVPPVEPRCTARGEKPTPEVKFLRKEAVAAVREASARATGLSNDLKQFALTRAAAVRAGTETPAAALGLWGGFFDQYAADRTAIFGDAVQALDVGFQAALEGVAPGHPLHLEFTPGTGGAADLLHRGLGTVIAKSAAAEGKVFAPLGQALCLAGFQTTWSPGAAPPRLHPSLVIAAEDYVPAGESVALPLLWLSASATCAGDVRVSLHYEFGYSQDGEEYYVELRDATTHELVATQDASNFAKSVTFTGIPPGRYTAQVVMNLIFFQVAGDVTGVTVPAWETIPDDPTCETSTASLTDGETPLALHPFYDGFRVLVGGTANFSAAWYDPAAVTGEFVSVETLLWNVAGTTGPIDIQAFLPEDLPPDASGAVVQMFDGFHTGTVHIDDRTTVWSPTSTAPITGTVTLANGKVLTFSLCPGDAPVVEGACSLIEGISAGSPQTFDPLSSGSRTQASQYFRLVLDFDDGSPGNYLFLFLNLMSGHPTQGQVEIDLVSTSPVNFTGAEIYRPSGYMTGKLVIFNMEDLVANTGKPIKMRAVSTDGQTVIDFCVQQAQAPITVQ
jgi:hypothetical protein